MTGQLRLPLDPPGPAGMAGQADAWAAHAAQRHLARLDEPDVDWRGPDPRATTTIHVRGEVL